MAVLRPLVLFFLPVDLRGTEHLEGGEPVLLCANHSSAWDPILFVLSMPQRFNVRIMAKKQLFSIPIVGGFLRAIGVFPVDRGNSDIGAVKTAIQSLRDGWNLFLFPEGTRVKTPGQADVKSGAGMMAIRARREAGAGIYRHEEAHIPQDAHHNRRALRAGVHRPQGYGGGIYCQRP